MGTERSHGLGDKIKERSEEKKKKNVSVINLFGYNFSDFESFEI